MDRILPIMTQVHGYDDQLSGLHCALILAMVEGRRPFTTTLHAAPTVFLPPQPTDPSQSVSSYQQLCLQKTFSIPPNLFLLVRHKLKGERKTKLVKFYLN